MGSVAFGAQTLAYGAPKTFFEISLAEWSLHRTLRSGKLDNLGFPRYAKEQFGIEAVEYVNQFFADKAKDKNYLSDLKTRAADAGVKSLLIMIDNEGELGAADKAKRKQAVENHYKWVEAAQFLGCHSIRVNAAGSGTKEAVMEAAVEGLGSLAEFAKDYDINVLVENHGGYSSDGQWLSTVMSKINKDNCGALPDFGNFVIDRSKNIVYDKYQGVKELMPYAKAVSAKCYDFENGQETTIDFERMMRIVKDAGYTGYVGIEYEGNRLSEDEGIKACKELLVKLRKKL